MKSIILFDIDYAILNTTLFKRNYRGRVAKLLNISIDEFCEKEKDYIQKEEGFTDFNPKEYIDFISKNYGVSTEDISKCFFEDDNFKGVVFMDVLGTLEDLSKDYTLGIFSEGLVDFQLLKLHKSKLLSFFDKDFTFIFRRKLAQESFDLLPKGCFIIDDNYFVIEALNKTKLFKPIWLNRKTKEKHPECVTVFDLINLRGILENYSTM